MGITEGLYPTYHTNKATNATLLTNLKVEVLPKEIRQEKKIKIQILGCHQCVHITLVHTPLMRWSTSMFYLPCVYLKAIILTNQWLAII